MGMRSSKELVGGFSLLTCSRHHKVPRIAEHELGQKHMHRTPRYPASDKVTPALCIFCTIRVTSSGVELLQQNAVQNNPGENLTQIAGENLTQKPSGDSNSMIRHDNDWPQRTLAWHAKLILEVQQHVLLELELEARVCLRGKGACITASSPRGRSLHDICFRLHPKNSHGRARTD